MAVYTYTLTAGTTSLNQSLPFGSVSILLRCPSSNTADVYVNFYGTGANTQSTRIRAGESIELSHENFLLFKAQLNQPINQLDYVQGLSYYSTAANQTLYIDVFVWSGV